MNKHLSPALLLATLDEDGTPSWYAVRVHVSQTGFADEEHIETAYTSAAEDGHRVCQVFNVDDYPRLGAIFDACPLVHDIDIV